MKIEELNKSQIVLLTMFVSFVTSIATGIVTIALVDQAPPAVAQTVNRVVERTVERVVPKETQVATVITQEKTVVVKESDLIAQAVQRVRPSVVRAYAASETEDPSGELLARGITVAPGWVVTSTLPKDATYVIRTAVGSFTGNVVLSDAGNGISLIKLKLPEGEKGPEATGFSTGLLTLGQTVIALTGVESTKVADGIISSIAVDDTGETPKQASFDVSISAESLVSGSTIVDTEGGVVGIFTKATVGIAPAHVVLALLSAAASTESTPDTGKALTQ